MNRFAKIGIAGALSMLCAACATVAGKTNILSDSKIVTQSAEALGYSPSDLTLVSRRTDGTNTYVQLRAGDGKNFHCVINGGNLLSMGMTNPPMCAKAGEPINASPFRR